MSTGTRIADALPHDIRLSASFARLLQSAIVILPPFVLVLGAIRLVATDTYLALEYGKADFPPDRFGFDTAQRLAYASANLRYVREGLSIDALTDQRLGDTPLYNSRELKHMQDVQRVYQAVWFGWMITTIPLSISDKE
ncbi:MAG TPA: hypothetical protein VJ793_00835 [Anaerolineae bacterium]|nr:hypothetical protein [Anaerolineae bacterium]